MITQLSPQISRMQTDSDKNLWKTVWKTKGTIPRVRLFFWKILQDALPVSSALAKWIQGIPARCKLCGEAQEDAVHLLFHCPHARATWFQSVLGLRTEQFIGMTMDQILEQLWQP